MFVEWFDKAAEQIINNIEAVRLSRGGRTKVLYTSRLPVVRLDPNVSHSQVVCLAGGFFRSKYLVERLRSYYLPLGIFMPGIGPHGDSKR